MKHIRKFNESVKNRGEIRKIADELLGHLHADLLSNIAYDNRENITKSLNNVKNSDINSEEYSFKGATMSEFPWYAKYEKGVPKTVSVKDMPLQQLLVDSAQKYPNNIALRLVLKYLPAGLKIQSRAETQRS